MIHPWQSAVRPMGRIGHAIESHVSIGSTNERARELLAGADVDGVVVVADEQTAGRGRRGRTWLSPPGLNLMASVALRPRLRADEAWQLGMAASLATLTACGALAAVKLKWPNDLVADDGRKLGGLLVETMASGERLTAAIVGIGVNVNWANAQMPPEIALNATSLADLSGEQVDRIALLARLLEALDEEVAAVEAGKSPLDRYRAACTTLGAIVSVATPDGSLHGRAVDLDGSGALVVEAEDGRHVVASGEVLRVRREAMA